MRRWTMGLAAAAIAMAEAASALADEPKVAAPDPDRDDLPGWRKSRGDLTVVGVELYGSGMMAAMDGYQLVGSKDAPDALAGKNLNLRGHGYLAGGGFRVTLQAPFGLRGGFGVGAYQLGGMSLLHDDLTSGVTIQPDDKPIVADWELFVGKAFDAGWMFPYADLKVSFDYVALPIDTNIAGYGFVGTSSYHVWAATVAPRVGAFIPVTDAFFIDASAQYGLTGIQRGGFFVGLGAWNGG